jgi:hypothetical protein
MGDMREALNAAIDAQDADLDDYSDEPMDQEDVVDDPVDEEQHELELDEPNEQTEEKIEAAPEAAKPGKKQKGPKDSLKAPVDWSPKEREDWSKIPRHLQEKIINREKQMAEGMAGTGEARQTHQHLQQLAQSYAPVLAAEGVSTPMQAVEGLFKTVASLRMGTPQDKATEMARLIQHYGVDIQALDSVLAGQAPQNSQSSQLDQILEQKLAPVNQLMAQMNQYQVQQKQQVQQSATQSVATFAQDHEFLKDVRNDMADLIEMAAKQGRELSLQEANDRACALHPEIQDVINQRKQQEALMGNGQALAAKHNAASSITGKRSGTPGAEAMSLRDSIANAWDNSMR